MAERKKNKKAEAAMDIADKFKEIEALATLIRAKVWQVQALMEAEEPNENTRTLGLLGASRFSSSSAATSQAIWHNIAFGRGYFETVEGPRKMSKTEIDR